MKELIEKLRSESRWYGSPDEHGYFNSGLVVLLANASDAIERLELEAVAATIRIENDAQEIGALHAHRHSREDVISDLRNQCDMVAERDEWKERCEFSFKERDKLLAINSRLVYDKESDRLAYLAMRDVRDAYQQAADTMAAAHKVERDGLELEAERYRAELLNIVNAERYNDEHFSDDSCFADWAQSRARFAAVKGT